MASNTSTPTPISKKAKWLAGILLVGLTTFSIVAVIAFWPDRLPDLSKKDTSVYECRLFHMRLLDSSELNMLSVKQGTMKSSIPDTTTDIGQIDSIAVPAKVDTNKTIANNNITTTTNQGFCCKIINLNTLLLILVALMGFLGNMIHMSTSFTTFVGNDSFKSSWLLWYCVKPFTAAGFAVILYFVLRGGFLSYNSGVANFNIYGILAMAALAGLFTDTATLKLKEVFDVIFKPKDDRGDKLNNQTQSSTTITTTTSDTGSNSNTLNNNSTPKDGLAFNVISVTPQQLNKDAENNIVLAGSGLNKQGLVIAIGSTTITSYTSTDTSISFSYTPNDEDKAGPSVSLAILQNNTSIYTNTLSFA